MPKVASFESVERLAKKAAQPVKQAVEATRKDVLESLGLKEVKPVTDKDRLEIEKRDRERIGQNLARINQQIVEARRKRERRELESGRVKEQEKAVKREKKQEKKGRESVLQKMLKSRMGTKEGMQRVSG